MEKYMKFVADLFECDPSGLTLETAYGEHEKWDSMMMLRLIMETEEEYGVTIPIEETGRIKRLADLYEYVKVL